MIEHTPGPWEVEPYYINSTTAAYIINSGANEPDWPTLIANARLIASAPDMLAELTALRSAKESYAERIRDWFESWRRCYCGKDEGKKYNTVCGHAINCDMYICEELIRAMAVETTPPKEQP